MTENLALAERPNAGAEYNATLAERVDINPRLAILRVRPDAAEFSFTPGQYATLALARSAPRTADSDPEEVPADTPGKLIKRAYSISSGSRTREFVEFYVALVASGELTPRLFALQAGDRLFISAKGKGLFTLGRVPAEVNLLMVATGTGLAPYVSMLRTHLAERPSQRLAVLHGASYSWDLGYRQDLERMAAHHPNLTYLPVVSRPDGGWGGWTGRLPAWLDAPALEAACGFPLRPDSTHVLLCGNPGMIEDSRTRLATRGFDPGTNQAPGSLHVEKYW